MRKETSNIATLLRKNASKKDFEAIYETGVCWSYEMGALIKAMRSLHYEDEDIKEVVSIVSCVQDFEKSGELEKIYEEFEKKFNL